LRELLADPVEAKRMGEAGRKRVEEYFSWRAIADQTIALYRGLVEARG
jgi:starch synthase